MLWTSPIYRDKKYVQKGSFFEECDRDDKGHCKPSGQGGESAKPDDDKSDSEHVVGENSQGDHLTEAATKSIDKAAEGIEQTGFDCVDGLADLMGEVENAVDDDEGTFDSSAIASIQSDANDLVQKATEEAEFYANTMVENVTEHLIESFRPEEDVYGDEEIESFDAEFGEAEEEFKESVNQAYSDFVDKCQIVKDALDDYIITRTTTNDDDPKDLEKALNDAVRNMKMTANDDFRIATVKASEKFLKRAHDVSPYAPPEEEDEGLGSSPIYKQVKTVVKGGFTGKKTDARGYNICYQNGKRVPCNALGEGKKKPASKKPAKKPVEQSVKEIRDLVESGQGTPEKLLGLISGHTIPELKKIQAELGLSIKGNPAKAKRADAIAQGALTLMKGKEEPEPEVKPDPVQPTPNPEPKVEPEPIIDDLPNPEVFDLKGKETSLDDLLAKMPKGISAEDAKRAVNKLVSMGKLSTRSYSSTGEVADIKPHVTQFDDITKEDIRDAFAKPIPIGERIAGNESLKKKLKSLESISSGKQAIKKKIEELKNKISSAKAEADKLKFGHPKRVKILNEITSMSQNLYDETVKASRAQDSDNHDALIKTLKVDNPAKIPIKFSQTVVSPVYKEKANKAHEFLSNVLAKGLGGKDMPQIRFAEFDGRAYYKDGIKSVYCTPEDGTDIFVHEMSHGVEFNMPGAHDACMEFLKYRIKDEEPTSLKKKFGGGYSENEIGSKDDFAKAFSDDPNDKKAEIRAYYVGKDYGVPGLIEAPATEILSMGVELLYKDPSGFAKRDPEYCSFVLGVLDGSLLKNQEIK